MTSGSWLARAGLGLWLGLTALVAGCSSGGTGGPGGQGGAGATATGGHGGGGAGGGGAGVPMACAITVSSAQIQGSTSPSLGGTCTPTLVDQTTIAITFTAYDNSNDFATGNIACTISATAGVPQTLHGRQGSAGCNLVIEYNAALGATDMWADDTSSTIDIVVTDIPTASGTINATLDDGMGSSMTVTGTF